MKNKLNISHKETEIIKECLQACLQNFFCDEEFETLFGFTRGQWQKIADHWPVNKNDVDTQQAVNAALNNLLSYPHGHWEDEAWHRYISVSSNIVRSIYYKILGFKEPQKIYNTTDLIAHLDQGTSVDYLFYEDEIEGDKLSPLALAYPCYFVWAEKIYHSLQDFVDEMMSAAISKDEESISRERLLYLTMLYGNQCKFGQSQKLREYLLSRDKKIVVYANQNDTLLGIGLSKSDSAALDPRTWKGCNLAGFSLMQARDVLYYEDFIK